MRLAKTYFLALLAGTVCSAQYTNTGRIFQYVYDAIGATSTQGLAIRNTTAATSGQQQWSPSLILEGRGWDAYSGTSKTSKWIIENAVQKNPNSADIADYVGMAGLRISLQIGSGTVYPFLHMYHDPTATPGSDSPIANLFIGFGAGNTTMTGASYGNLGFGHGSLQSLTSGDENSGFGYNALKNVTTGTWNHCMGIECLGGLTTGSYNVGLGQDAGGAVAPPTLTTGNYNSFVGTQSRPCTSAERSYMTVLGEHACGDQDYIQVLGKPGTKASVGGLPKAKTTFEVADVGSLGSEVLQNPSFTSGTAWTLFYDATITGGQLVCSGSGSNECVADQAVVDFANTAYPSRWYKFAYTLAAAPTINTSCAVSYFEENGAGGITLPVMNMGAGAHWIAFRSNSPVDKLRLGCNWSSGGGVTFDDISLKMITDGGANFSGTVRGVLNTVASGSTVSLPTGNVFSITGTTGITTINACDKENVGRVIILIFADAVTVTDGSNLKLAGDFTSTADDTLTLVCDGSNWFETGRSAN